MPQQFSTNVRYSRIHLDFLPRSAKLIGQLSLVPIFDTNSLRYIYGGFSARPSPFSDVTTLPIPLSVGKNTMRTDFTTPRTLSDSDRISTMGATSCSMHGTKDRTAHFHISDPFRAIIMATPLRHTFFFFFFFFFNPPADGEK